MSKVVPYLITYKYIFYVEFLKHGKSYFYLNQFNSFEKLD
jgi:hypothetical protein